MKIRFLTPILLWFLLVAPFLADAAGLPWHMESTALIAQSGHVAPVRSSVENTDLATDGVHLLAAWDDTYRLKHLGQDHVYSVVVGPDGQLATPQSVFLGEGIEPQAFSTGSGWVVVWGLYGVFARPLDPSGIPLDPHRIKLGEEPVVRGAFAAAEKDGRIALVWSEQQRNAQPEIFGMAIDGSANVLLAKRRISEEGASLLVQDLVPVPEGFLLAGTTGEGNLFLQSLSHDLRPIGERLVMSRDQRVTRVRIGRNGSHLVAVWQQGGYLENLPGNAVYSAAVSSRGDLLSPVHRVTETSRAIDLTVSAAGEGFLAVWGNADHRDETPMTAIQLDTNGAPVPAPARALGFSGSDNPSVAETADGRIAVLMQSADGVPRLRRYDSNLQPLSDEITVSVRVAGPAALHLAPHPDGFLAVWDESGVGTRAAIIGPDGALRSEPSLIDGGAADLIPVDGGYVALLRRGSEGLLVRLDMTGQWERLVATLASPCYGRGAVAWNGAAGYAVLCGGGLTLLSEDGPQRTAGFFNEDSQLIATQTGWYLVWKSNSTAPDLQGIAISTEGSPIGEPRVLVPYGFLPRGMFELVNSGENTVIVWHSQSNSAPANDYLGVVVVGPDGAPLVGSGEDPRIITEGWNQKVLDSVWREGDVIHVAWVERAASDQPWRLVRTRLDRSGALIDPPPHQPLVELPFYSTPSAWSGSRFGMLRSVTPEGDLPRITLTIAAPVRARPVRIRR